jgi:hypothetical protein
MYEDVLGDGRSEKGFGGDQDLTPKNVNPQSKPKSKILFGDNEPIFSKLPGSVLSNLEQPRSENALLWNSIYPLSQPTLSLLKLIHVRPLWGTAELEIAEDQLIPYFWGFNVGGEKLATLEQVLVRIDGRGPYTEVDLFLLGKNNLIAVEAKHLSSLGRCSRFSHKRCPEIHRNEQEEEEGAPCRYWEEGQQEFRSLLDFGERPAFEDPPPPCNQHYQLARTMLVGRALASEWDLDFSLWMLVTKTQWRSIEKNWIDFTERVREDEVWKRMRVLAWEDLQKIDIS